MIGSHSAGSVATLFVVLVGFAAPPLHAQGRSAGGPPLDIVGLDVAAFDDYRASAGRVVDGTLQVALEAREAAWYPWGPDRQGLRAHVFAEAAGRPLIPGPMIRVGAGTPVRVSVRNTFPDTLLVRGLSDRGQIGGGPLGAVSREPLVVAPGGSADVHFTPTVPGTYFYFGRVLAGGWSAGREPDPIELRSGCTHRLRFMHISPDDDKLVRLLAGEELVTWRHVAKDGADLPRGQVREIAAELRIHVGETYDFLWTPAAGEYTLRILTTFDRGAPAFPRDAPAPETQDVIVRVLPDCAEAEAVFGDRWHTAAIPPSYSESGFTDATYREGGSSGLLKGALIGAAVGGAAGLVLFEVAESQLGPCDSDEPNCEISPSRIETAVVGAALGGIIGAVIGSRRSSRDWIPLPRVAPSLHGGVSIGFRTVVLGG